MTRASRALVIFLEVVVNREPSIDESRSGATQVVLAYKSKSPRSQHYAAARSHMFAATSANANNIQCSSRSIQRVKVTMTSDVKLWCDDFVFQIDTNTNPMRYRTRATWWRSRPAHNLQRSNGAGPPCHPRTPPKAAQPNAQSPQPVKKKEFGNASFSYSTRQGQERGFQPSARCAVPLCVSYAQGALTEHPPGAGAPTGHPPGGMVGPLFRQTDGVIHILDSASTS